MDLRNTIIAAIVMRWQRGDRPVESRNVYADLTTAGITVPDGVMDMLLRSLDQQGWVIVFHQPYQDALAQHGDAAITWIGEQWLGEASSRTLSPQTKPTAQPVAALRQRKKPRAK